MMTGRFSAIVEQGRLRPVVPIDLPEGATVDVWITTPDAKITAKHSSAAEILATIAALPSEPVEPSTSDCHDDVLYCPEAHP